MSREESSIMIRGLLTLDPLWSGGVINEGIAHKEITSYTKIMELNILNTYL
jgi:hypothetical protein